MSLNSQVKTIIVQSIGGLVALAISFAGLIAGVPGLLVSVPLGVITGCLLIAALERLWGAGDGP